VLGLGRLILELNKGRLDGILFTYANINFLHFAALLFALCTVVLVLASLTAPPPSADRIAGLTYQSTTRADETRRPVGLEVLLSVILVLAIAAIWLYFSE
jgi:SSS family solute:Na+ symporter